MATTYLYRAKDMEGCVLYVGVTSNPQQRLTTHTYTAPWRDIAVLPFDWIEFNTKEEARAFELAEIRRLKPRFNRAGNPDKSFNIPNAITRININIAPSTRDTWKRAGVDRRMTMTDMIEAAMMKYLSKPWERGAVR